MPDNSTKDAPGCGNCRFCKSGHRPDKQIFLKCCYDPPKVNPFIIPEQVQTPTGMVVNKIVVAPTGWPEVQSDWWCGKYERQLH